MKKINSVSKNCIAVAFFLISGLFINNCNAQIFKIEPNAKSPWKSPSLASIQALILPGAGYLYQDKMELGYAVMGGEMLMFGIGNYFYSKPVETKGRLASSVTQEVDRNRAIGGVFFAIAGGVHLFQFVHSGILAHQSNKVNGYVKNDMEVNIYNKGLGVAVAVSF